MKNNEMKNTVRAHWYDEVETGIERYPRYWLTHMNGSKRYTIMVLSWDTEKQIANGWFALTERDTIKECRNLMKKNIAVWSM